VKTILIIEDDSVTRSSIQLILSKSGFNVLEAPSGDRGLQILQHQLPDLILSDVYMRHGDGYHVLEYLNSTPRTSSIPLILMTGHQETMDFRKAMTSGADDFLLKPFRESDLLNAIQARLRRREALETILNESRHTLQLILNNLPLRVFWKDQDSRYLGCNQPFAKDAGFDSPEDLIGQTDFQTSWKDFAHAYRADDRSVMSQNQPRLGYEEQQPQTDGSLRWLRTSKIPLRDSKGSVTGVLGLYEDITHWKTSEQDLKDALAYNETLLNASPIGIIAFNASGQAISANPAAAQLTGSPNQATLNLNFHELPSWRSSGLLEAARKSLADSSEHELQATLTTHSGTQTPVSARFVPFHYAHQPHLLALLTNIQQQKQTEEELRKLYRALEQTPASIVITNTKGEIEYVNPKFVEVSGYSPAEVLGQNPRVLKSGETPPAEYSLLWKQISLGKEWRGEFHNRRKNGELYWESAVISPIKDEHGIVTHFLAVKEDITELKRNEKRRNEMELQLRHAQKMESIGQLAAGIAHEINTPTQFVGDNLHFLSDAFRDLLLYLKACSSPPPQTPDGTREWCENTKLAAQNADLDYLLREIPQALTQSLEGVQRVTRIVRAMKDFSHPGSEKKTPVNLNHALETTVTVSRNEWKYVADVLTDLDPSLPPVPCLPGELNQVILNLIVNASHAIADTLTSNTQAKGTISIQTRQVDNDAQIRITDSGSGIPENIRQRVFDPFFTTKGVGKGTGQGLAIAHSVIVDKHGGSIQFSSEVGKGTTFTILLPLQPAPPSPKTAP
jgi:PAS domain S-box-containing protein